MVWVPRKKWKELHRKIAGLETAFQNQQKLLKEHMNEHEESIRELKNIIKTVKN